MKHTENYGTMEISIINENVFDSDLNSVLVNYDSNLFLDPTYHNSCAHGITVIQDALKIASTLLFGDGGATSVHKHSMAIIGDGLFVCIGNSIAALSMPSLLLLWKTEIDPATAFQIFAVDCDLIIHGELAVSRLDTHGKIIWQKFGSDIFVTNDDEPAFEIRNNTIYAKSWDGRKYQFEFDGKETSNFE